MDFPLFGKGFSKSDFSSLLVYILYMILHDIHKKIIYMMVTMVFVALVALSIGISILYQVALDEERMRLVETVQSQARLMEAVARFDQEHAGVDAFNATLGAIREAHEHFLGFGKTGEFTLAKLENNQIIFLLNHRHDDMRNLRPVAFDAKIAEPMRRALQGKSGTVIGLDYRGETVLAAFEPVKELNLGVVAKIDLKEIRAPFVHAAWISLAITLALIVVGLLVFYFITKPIQTRITRAIKTISGIIPLCAWCGAKIRDDNDEWVQLDTYLNTHSDATVSHGMCPECAEKFNREAKNQLKPEQ